MELGHSRARFGRSLRPPVTLGLDPLALDHGTVTCIAGGLRRPDPKEGIHQVSDLAAAHRYLRQSLPRIFGGGRPQLTNAHGAILGIARGRFKPFLFTFEAARKSRLEIAHEELHLVQDCHSSFSP
jgi:hypothetical protein